MSSVVPQRPACRRCGGELRRLRCTQCGRWSFLHLILPRIGRRW